MGTAGQTTELPDRSSAVRRPIEPFAIAVQHLIGADRDRAKMTGFDLLGFRGR